MPGATPVNPHAPPLAAPPADEADLPHPPRYWWLKRLTAGLLLLVLSLAAVRAAWGREARRRSARELSSVVAAGDPISLDDLRIAPVPDAENGAPVYRRAMAAIGVESPSSSSLSYNDWVPFPPRWHKLEDRSIAANGAMLRAVREARAYGKFDWQLQLKQPLFGYYPPHTSRAHHLSNVLGDAALHAHIHGDDVEAIERIRDQRHLAVALGAAPTLVGVHEFRVYSIEGTGLYKLQIIAAGLTVAPGDDDGGAEPPPVPSTAAVRPAPRPATRAQVRALVRELIDDREQAAGLRRGYATERAVQLDVAGWLGRKAPLLRPMFQIDAVRVARAQAAVVAAAEAPNLPASKQTLRGEPLLAPLPQSTLWKAPGTTIRLGPVDERPIDYTRFLATDVCNTPRVTRTIDWDFHTRADRHLAAASLAIQLYRVDHGAQFPPSLDALVPKYLPAVPVDPFAADGSPVRYVIIRGGLPGGGDRPLIYSVGPDGADDTATRGPAGAGVYPVPTHSLAKGPDLWVDVSRWTPVETDQQRQDDAELEKAAGPIVEPSK